MHFTELANLILKANNVKMAIDFERETGSKLESQPFRFSEEVLEVNQQKSLGHYKHPDWQRITKGATGHKQILERLNQILEESKKSNP